MPIRDYGVLTGRVLDTRIESGTDSPHFQVLVEAGSTRFRLAVNVRSSSRTAAPELLYLADEAFEHPILQQLLPLPEGFTEVSSVPGGAALDYIRGNLFDRTSMRPMPSSVSGDDNDLADKLEHYMGRAQRDPGARIYAFGARWGPESGKPDKIFGFEPGDGVHDLHMNQGNDADFMRDDGVWQDGGLMLHFPDADQWVTIFLAFQSQAWHTDDVTGHRLDAVVEADHAVRVVAALVNAVGPAPESETVTLVNATAADLDLSGWSICDRMKNAMPLTGIGLGAGEAVRVPVRLPVQLGNSGGLITVLDADGLKVDGVSYTAQQAGTEGWTIVF
jgi:uncharacterized protein YukJ